MLVLVLYVLAAFAVGAYVQVRKRRVGAVWGLITFGVGMVWWYALYQGLREAQLQEALTGGFDPADPAWRLTEIFAGPVLTGIVMWLVALTLPKKAGPPPSGDR